MVFKRLQVEYIEIDGVTYEVNNSWNQDHFDCKEKFLNFIFVLEQYYDDDALTLDTLQSFKKDLTSKLKDFEKKYVKHAKSTNPALSDIHKKAMQPVSDLMEAAVNLDNFRNLSKDREFPDFRRKALVEKFIEHLSNVCRILTAFPNPEQKTLCEEYDIRHILELLDIEECQKVNPFKFYMAPMQSAFDRLIAELRAMWKKGPLRVSYYVERNLEMTKRIYELVR